MPKVAYVECLEMKCVILINIALLAAFVLQDKCIYIVICGYSYCYDGDTDRRIVQWKPKQLTLMKTLIAVSYTHLLQCAFLGYQLYLT